MNKASVRPFDVFIFKNPQGIGIGIAGVDYHRQATFTGRLDMGSETRFLGLPWAVLIMIIKPGLAKPDDLGMPRHANKLTGRDFRLVSHFVRMNPGREKNVIEAFGYTCQLV